MSLIFSWPIFEDLYISKNQDFAPPFFISQSSSLFLWFEVFFLCCCLLCWEDLNKKILPRGPLFFMAITIFTLGPWIFPLSALLIFCVLYLLSLWKPELLGGGDIKLMTLLGLLLDLDDVPMFFFLSGLGGIIFFILKKKPWLYSLHFNTLYASKEKIPFVPCILLSFWLIFTRKILNFM